MKKPVLVIVCGPTATGKSALAIKLAREFGGEVVGADSMQVYRYMDIGTAKPTVEERAEVRHHLIDVVNPDEDFNAGMYVEKARQAVETLNHERKPAWVVGGTGLYIRALTAGLVDGPGTDKNLRARYVREMKEYGIRYLHEKLKIKDREAAERIHPNDAVRVMRALEYIETSGEPLSLRQRNHRFADRPYDCLKIGMTDERAFLYRKIDSRCDRMVKNGLVGEVEGLLARGFAEDLRPMQSLGYRHIVRHLTEGLPLAEALSLMKQDTRNYAKRQMTWFRADREVRWFGSADWDGIRKEVEAFLGGMEAVEMS
ncbi:MAG TPA: tRNA (adenosine(37)-N6)-dimethylallyltransferase MiaA [Syntrophales bacterium]|nr:tRNA (adenosine(37)-N6)-dimethylallyltransferase MiaA [Syntrophales bacterium]